MGSICFVLSQINWQLTLPPFLMAKNLFSVFFPPRFQGGERPIARYPQEAPGGAKKLWVRLAVLECSVCTCGQYFRGFYRLWGKGTNPASVLRKEYDVELWELQMVQGSFCFSSCGRECDSVFHGKEFSGKRCSSPSPPPVFPTSTERTRR